MIQEDNCYIRYLNYPIFKTQLIRFYKINEFQCKTASIKKLYKPILLKSNLYSFDYYKYTREKERKFDKEKNEILNGDIEFDFESLFED